MWPSPCVSETEVVVLPSPAFVGVIAVTQTSFASGRAASRSSTDRSIFALYRPYGSTSSGRSPADSAISVIGLRVADCAISRLDGMLIGVSSPRGVGLGQWETAAAASSDTSVSVWKRSSANGAISSGVLPVAASSASVQPTIGAALKP